MAEVTKQAAEPTQKNIYHKTNWRFRLRVEITFQQFLAK